MSAPLKALKGAPFDSSGEDRVIVAFLLARSMGAFVAQNLFAASVKRSIDRSRLCVYWRNDRPFKGPLLGLNGHVTNNWGAQRRAVLPLDAFDDASGKPIHVKDLDWFRHNCHRPFLVLTPSMMRAGWPGAFEAPARFHWPDDRGSRLDQALIALGVDPDRWFCVVKDPHSNDPDDPPTGDVSPAPADTGRVIERIIHDLGGQVVRVGHGVLSGMDPVADRIDLPDGATRPLLLARTVARARFYFELAPSGTMMLAAAAGVPAGRGGDRVVEGGLSETDATLDALARSTAACTGWRVPEPETAVHPTARIRWSLQNSAGLGQ